MIRVGAVVVALSLTSPVGAAPVLPKAVGAWQLAEGPKRYTGRKIYSYMDGAAEVHRLYGFRSLQVYRFARRELSIKVELFDMGSPEGAFGDFTHARDLEGDPVNVGQDGHYQSGVLWFWKARYLACVSSRARRVGRADLEKLARAVARSIKKKGRRPDLVRVLPRAGLRERTVRYFRRPAALAYHYGEFQHAKLLDLRQGAEAVMADYRRGGRPAVLLVVRYPTLERAKTARRRLATKGRLRKDARGKWRGISRHGGLLRVVLEAPSKTEAEALLRRKID
jgi:hypothetical protein